MADDSGPPIVLKPSTWQRVKRVLAYVEGMMRAKIPGGSNGPNGPVFPDLRQAKTPNAPVPKGGGATTDYLQDTTDVGVFDTLNMHSSLADVFQFEDAGTRADLSLKASTAYYVVQMDSTGTKLILAPARGIA